MPKLKVSKNIKTESSRNASLLREMFGLPEITEDIKENVIAEMKGMLEEYSDDEMDSVEMLHLYRGE